VGAGLGGGRPDRVGRGDLGVQERDLIEQRVRPPDPRVDLRLAAVADLPDVAAPAPSGQRPVFDPATQTFADIAQYRRDDLSPGMRVAGPAIIAEDETSTFVSASFDARIDASGFIVMDRRA